MALNDERFRERLKEAFGSDTQTAVGEKLHITQGNVSKYLAGSQLPPMDVLVRIAEVYGVSVDWLLGLSDRKRPSAGVSYGTAAENLLALERCGAVRLMRSQGELEAELKDPLLSALLNKAMNLKNADRESYLNWIKTKLSLFEDRCLIRSSFWQDSAVREALRYADGEPQWLQAHDLAKEAQENYREERPAVISTGGRLS